MRITGGKLCGRKVATPPGDAVRPTQDRVREALFNMLAPTIGDATFIDLFAGSGAVGLEAYSRGAAMVTWVEQAPRHVALIKKNIAQLLPQEEQGTLEVVTGEVQRWLRSAGRQRCADIIFADPPYAPERAPDFDALMQQIAQNAVLKPRGLLIAEMPDIIVEAPPAWQVLRERTYGRTRLAIYQLQG